MTNASNVAMASDPGIEACSLQPAREERRSETENGNTQNERPRTDDNPGSESETTDDRSVTAIGSASSSPRAGNVEVVGVDKDTGKFHVHASDLEAKPLGTAPEVVRHSIGLEPISNLEILNNSQQPPSWLTRRRWFILGCAILILLIIAVIVIGLVAGLVLTRRDGGSSASETSNTTAEASRRSVCGTYPRPIHRQLLAAAEVGSDVYLFARGLDDDIWSRSLSGTNSTWNTPWQPWIPLNEKFAGPPTAVSWLRAGDQRLHVFAPAQRPDKQSVLTAGLVNGSWPTTWQNLGESSGTPVSLCVVPQKADGSPARIDQWVVNQDTRGISHNFWNNVIEDFQEPATYADWEASPSVQPSASSLTAICRSDDPQHTLLMFANGTDSVRFRHYTDRNKMWNSWVDIGGRFIGDPVLVSITNETFVFFGINVDGDLRSFNYTSTTGVGYRPAIFPLGGNFTSMPSAIVTEDNPLRLDVVALGTDGFLKHKTYQNKKWEADWRDLGIRASSAPLLHKFEVTSDGNPRNRTMLTAIGADNQLQYAVWDSKNTLPWTELVGSWESAGGNLTTKSMCD